jgi:hypothetical protein
MNNNNHDFYTLQLKNPEKFSKLNFNLKSLIFQYLDIRDIYITYTMPEFHRTFKNTKLLSLYQNVIKEFNSKFKTPFNEILQKNFLENKIKKYRTTTNTHILNFCLGLSLSNLLKIQNIKDYTLILNINKDSLFYLSLMIACNRKFEGFYIEVKNTPDIRSPSFQEAFRKLFYSMKQNENFKFIRWTIGESFLTYKREEKMIMLYNIYNPLAFNLYKTMYENLKEKIEKLHFNFSNAHVFGNIFDIDQDSDRIKYISLNLMGFSDKNFRRKSVQNWFKKLVEYKFTLDHFYLVVSENFKYNEIKSLLEGVKTKKMEYEILEYSVENKFKYLKKNQFEKMSLCIKNLNAEETVELLIAQKNLKEFEISNSINPTFYNKLFHFLAENGNDNGDERTPLLKIVKITHLTDNEKDEVCESIMNMIRNNRTLTELHLIENKLWPNAKEKIIQVKREFNDKLQIYI